MGTIQTYTKDAFDERLKSIDGYSEQYTSANGGASGAITLSGNAGTYALDLVGDTDLTLTTRANTAPTTVLDVVCNGHTLTVENGPTITNDGLFALIYSRGMWKGGNSAAASTVEPDTTAPSQPGLALTSNTDTSVTLAVTRGQDDESKPSLSGRYYATSDTTKPSFAAISLASDGSWTVTGLTQNTSYTFDVQETSKGGTSPVTSLSVTTSKTKGWAVSSSLNLAVADGTALSSLTMSDGQAVTASASGGATFAVQGGTLAGSTANGTTNGAAAFKLTGPSTMKLGRLRAKYTFAAGSGSGTDIRLKVIGGYPMGSVTLRIDAASGLSFNTDDSNATWNAPVWTGTYTGLSTSGTVSISVDSDNKTVYAWIDGTQVGSITTTSTLPGITKGELDLDLWGGGGVTVTNVDFMSYQN